MQLAAHIRDLGEVALASDDVDRLTAFYRDTLGLKVLREFEGESRTTFFELVPGHQGHSQVLAIFQTRDGRPRGQSGSPLHHFAVNIDSADYKGIKQQLIAENLLAEELYHAWVNWSSLYIDDPDGNRMELVAVGDMAR